MEEAQAEQDLELVQFGAKEMEQRITEEMSVAAKTQLEVGKARHDAAASELESVIEFFEAIQGEHASLIRERDMSIKKAEEAVSASKEVKETVEDLTIRLIMARESLASAHAAHIEAEEHRIAAVLATNQDAFIWQKELKQAEETKCLKEQIEQTKNLKSELETVSNLILCLRGELAAYVEAKLNQESGSIEGENPKDGTGRAKKSHLSIQTSLASIKKELEEVKIHIERARDEANCLKVAAMSLKAELENEKAALASMKEKEETTSVIVSSIQVELDRTISELRLAQWKENEAREQMVELPKALQKAAQEADDAKSVVQLAREELQKTKEEARQAQANASAIEIRLHATLKEIEALNASEMLSLAATKALQECERAASTAVDDSYMGVTLQLEEYYMLSMGAHETEESADERVAIALSQIEAAKESKLRTLEKLDAINRKLAERKEAVRVATEEAEKAKERQLAAAQELRMRRSEHEKQQEAGNATQAVASPLGSSARSSEQHRDAESRDPEEAAAVLIHQTSAAKMRKPENDADDAGSKLKLTAKGKSLFPRLVTFLARKKTQPLK